MERKITDFIILIIQVIALFLNLIEGYVKHDVFYIAIAIIFAIFIAGDFIEAAIDRKE